MTTLNPLSDFEVREALITQLRKSIAEYRSDLVVLCEAILKGERVDDTAALYLRKYVTCDDCGKDQDEIGELKQCDGCVLCEPCMNEHWREQRDMDGQCPESCEAYDHIGEGR